MNQIKCHRLMQISRLVRRINTMLWPVKWFEYNKVYMPEDFWILTILSLPSVLDLSRCNWLPRNKQFREDCVQVPLESRSLLQVKHLSGQMSGHCQFFEIFKQFSTKSHHILSIIILVKANIFVVIHQSWIIADHLNDLHLSFSLKVFLLETSPKSPSSGPIRS